MKEEPKFVTSIHQFLAKKKRQRLQSAQKKSQSLSSEIQHIDFSGDMSIHRTEDVFSTRGQYRRYITQMNKKLSQSSNKKSNDEQKSQNEVQNHHQNIFQNQTSFSGFQVPMTRSVIVGKEATPKKQEKLFKSPKKQQQNISQPENQHQQKIIQVQKKANLYPQEQILQKFCLSRIYSPKVHSPQFECNSPFFASLKQSQLQNPALITPYQKQNYPKQGSKNSQKSEQNLLDSSGKWKISEERNPGTLKRQQVKVKVYEQISENMEEKPQKKFQVKGEINQELDYESMDADELIANYKNFINSSKQSKATKYGTNSKQKQQQIFNQKNGENSKQQQQQIFIEQNRTQQFISESSQKEQFQEEQGYRQNIQEQDQHQNRQGQQFSFVSQQKNSNFHQDYEEQKQQTYLNNYQQNIDSQVNELQKKQYKYPNIQNLNESFTLQLSESAKSHYPIKQEEQISQQYQTIKPEKNFQTVPQQSIPRSKEEKKTLPTKQRKKQPWNVQKLTKSGEKSYGFKKQNDSRKINKTNSVIKQSFSKYNGRNNQSPFIKKRGHMISQAKRQQIKHEREQKVNNKDWFSTQKIDYQLAQLKVSDLMSILSDLEDKSSEISFAVAGSSTSHLLKKFQKLSDQFIQLAREAIVERFAVQKFLVRAGRQHRKLRLSFAEQAQSLSFYYSRYIACQKQNRRLKQMIETQHFQESQRNPFPQQIFYSIGIQSQAQNAQSDQFQSQQFDQQKNKQKLPSQMYNHVKKTQEEPNKPNRISHYKTQKIKSKRKLMIQQENQVKKQSEVEKVEKKKFGQNCSDQGEFKGEGHYYEQEANQSFSKYLPAEHPQNVQNQQENQNNNLFKRNKKRQIKEEFLAQQQRSLTFSQKWVQQLLNQVHALFITSEPNRINRQNIQSAANNQNILSLIYTLEEKILKLSKFQEKVIKLQAELQEAKNTLQRQKQQKSFRNSEQMSRQIPQQVSQQENMSEQDINQQFIQLTHLFELFRRQPIISIQQQNLSIYLLVQALSCIVDLLKENKVDIQHTNSLRLQRKVRQYRQKQQRIRRFFALQNCKIQMGLQEVIDQFYDSVEKVIQCS